MRHFGWSGTVLDTPNTLVSNLNLTTIYCIIVRIRVRPQLTECVRTPEHVCVCVCVCVVVVVGG